MLLIRTITQQQLPFIIHIFIYLKCVSTPITHSTPPPPSIHTLISFILFSLFETTQTLFWAVFGLVDLDSFELEGIKIFTRFWGMLMFGTYSVINIVVLLNLLIAMMNHSYQLISVSGYVYLFHTTSIHAYMYSKRAWIGFSRCIWYNWITDW